MEVRRSPSAHHYYFACYSPLVLPARGSFAEIASLFHERVFVPLVAYADESGTHDASGIQPGGEVAVVAGWVAWKEDWDWFDEEWRQALADYHVPVFRMSDFANEERIARTPSSPYHGWDREKRDRFVRDLIVIARHYSVLGIVAGLSIRDYNAVVPERLRQRVGHPFHFCFQLFFDNLLPLLRNKFEPPLPPDDQVAFFFHQQRQFKEKALRVFDAIKTLKDTDSRMGGIAFEDEERYTPLQAADLLAGRARKMITRQVAGKPTITPGSWDDELFRLRNIDTSYYEAGALRALLGIIERAEGSEPPSPRGERAP
jgi:hypothetical protein